MSNYKNGELFIISLVTSCVYLVLFILLSLTTPLLEWSLKELGVALSLVTEITIYAYRFKIGKICIVVAIVCLTLPVLKFDKSVLIKCALCISVVGLMSTGIFVWGITDGTFRILKASEFYNNFLYRPGPHPFPVHRLTKR